MEALPAKAKDKEIIAQEGIREIKESKRRTSSKPIYVN